MILALTLPARASPTATASPPRGAATPRYALPIDHHASGWTSARQASSLKLGRSR
jgi:hypothetical protein